MNNLEYITDIIGMPYTEHPLYKYGERAYPILTYTVPAEKYDILMNIIDRFVANDPFEGGALYCE